MPDIADLQIYQGDDYAGVVTVLNSDGSIPDLTGYTAQAQIRADVADNALTVLAQLSATVAAPNHVNLALAHTATAALPGGKYPWDLQITSPSTVITTILKGKAVITQEVTRP